LWWDGRKNPIDGVNFTEIEGTGGSFWSIRGKKKRGRPETARAFLKGNTLGLQVDLDRERFLLRVLFVVLVLVTAATAGAGTRENGADGECGENRREED
jgi:hypothetical protein